MDIWETTVVELNVHNVISSLNTLLANEYKGWEPFDMLVGVYQGFLLSGERYAYVYLKRKISNE